MPHRFKVSFGVDINEIPSISNKIGNEGAFKEFLMEEFFDFIRNKAIDEMRNVQVLDKPVDASENREYLKNVLRVMLSRQAINNLVVSETDEKIEEDSIDVMYRSM